MSKPKLTTDEFVKRAKSIHGDKYDYSLVKYINYTTKIIIICPKHGIFEQRPDKHLSKCGCQKCGIEKLDTYKFIQKSNEIHNFKYDYSESEYKGGKEKIKIICPKHGIFQQNAGSHLEGHGCNYCRNNIPTTHEFIKKSNLVHNNKYDYSLVVYKNNHNKIKIICPKHGIFIQSPQSHIDGNGCSKCNSSKGERFIEAFLIKNNIKYITQYKFKDCINKRYLSFDFYIIDKNILIEYQGQQHYDIMGFLDAETADLKLKRTQINDAIKKEYCLKNNINLIEITYKENIETRLKDIFKV